MQVGADDVAGPEDDVAGVDEALRVGARRGADRHEVRGARAESQKVRSPMDAPSLLKKASPTLSPLRMPSVPR